MKLSNISKTLFFTLCSRAMDSNFNDYLAQEILKIKPELKKYRPDFFTQQLIVNRAQFFDRQIVRKKNQYPTQKWCLINLGGGLCSRFERVKSSISNSIHLDLPEVIDLVDHLFPQKPKSLISADLSDFSWVEQVKKQLNENEIPIFCMEGVSMYLNKNIFLQITKELQDNFLKGVFICDLLHPFFSGKSYLVNSVSKVGADFTSGIKTPNEILDYSPKLQLEIVKPPFTKVSLPFNLYQFATFSWGL